MFNFPLPIFNPSECFPFYRYVLARYVPSHRHLVEIFTVDLGISSIGYLYYLAIKARTRHPKSPPLIKVIGGSSHAANIPNSRLEEMFRTVAEATGINHGFLAFHRSRSGRVDFHFLFVNSTPEGRLLVQSLVKFRKAFRKAMREVVHAYNLERLDDGGLSIGNLSPRGRTFFVEPLQPEPAPEITRPDPNPSAEILPATPTPLTQGTVPNPLICTEPPASEPAGLHAPATTSLDIDPAIPTSDVVTSPPAVIPPAAASVTANDDPESPPATDSPANPESPSPAPSASAPAAIVIDAEIPTSATTSPPAETAENFSIITVTPEPPVAVGFEPGRDQTVGLFDSPTLRLTTAAASTPTPINSPRPSIEPTSSTVATPVDVAAPINACNPNGPITEAEDSSQITPAPSRGTGSPDAPVLHLSLLPPIPSAQPSQFQPDDASASAAAEAKAAPKSSEPSLVELTAHREYLRVTREAEAARIRAKSQEEKAAKEKAELAAKTALERSRFNWELQVARIHKFARKPGRKTNPLDLEAGAEWDVWLPPHPGIPRPALRAVLVQIRAEAKSNPDFAGQEYFAAVEACCGPVLISPADLAAREKFNWERLTAKLYDAADEDNPLDQRPDEAWAPWLSSMRANQQQPTLRELLIRLREIAHPAVVGPNANPDAAEFYAALEARFGPIENTPDDLSLRKEPDSLSDISPSP